MSDLSLEDQNTAERQTELIATNTDLGPNQLERFPDGVVLQVKPGAHTAGTFDGINGVAGGSGRGLVGQGEGAGVFGDSGNGVGVRGHSQANDGVVGLSDANGKSGVFGFNSKKDGAAFGVVGTCDSPEGSGVAGGSGPGVGVRGHSQANDGVVGLSDANGKSGVFGFNSKKDGAAFGVVGTCDSPEGSGVAGGSGPGVGVQGTGKTGVQGQSTTGERGFLGGKDPQFGQSAGVYGESAAQGVMGLTTDPAGTGVYGGGTTAAGGGQVGVRGETLTGTGVQGTSNTGVGVIGTSQAGDGVVGITDTNNKSGVFGFNSVGGPGVTGASKSGDGVSGHSEGFNRSGVIGENTATPSKNILAHVFGVTGRANAAAGTGVLGDSASGIGVSGQGGTYGGTFQGGSAPVRLVPSNNKGAPTSGSHLMGELYVDSEGNLFFCKSNGIPGTWVKLA